MNLFLSFLFLLITVILYTIRELYYHGKLKWITYGAGFWGNMSWTRKYHKSGTVVSNWYYRFFKVGNREAFPGSATVFVMFTDGMHLTQFFMTKFLYASIAILTDNFLLWFAVLWIVWGLGFTMVYKLLSR